MSKTQKPDCVPNYTPSQFKKLSKKQQRLAVAKDVLAQLEAKVFTAARGAFVEMNVDFVDDEDLDTFDIYASDARKFFTEEKDSCTACALGSAVIAKARLNNKVSLGELEDNADHSVNVEDYLGDIFDKSNLKLIEVAFELGGGSYVVQEDYEGNVLPEYERALKFGNRFKNVRNRMKAIWQNVVDNDGEFKP